MMAWQAIDRIKPSRDDADEPLLSEAVKARIRAFFPRYPTKRAALLPALHIVQETYGYISHRAMRDVADLLDIAPSAVLDTLSFYNHYWTHPRGKKVIVSCRSLACELMGAREVNETIAAKLGVGEHGTTEDGAYSFVTEECLGACEHAPCLLINEKLHKCVKAGDVPRLLADDDNDTIDVERSDLYDGVPPELAEASKLAGPDGDGKDDADVEAVLESTSDVDEMKNAD
jgi:NADH-quinone oxidoreductase subunit E